MHQELICDRFNRNIASEMVNYLVSCREFDIDCGWVARLVVVQSPERAMAA